MEQRIIGRIDGYEISGLKGALFMVGKQSRISLYGDNKELMPSYCRHIRRGRGC